MNKKGPALSQPALSQPNLLKGFTLIELMVAIAIVAVLATIGFSLFQNTQAQARDARRKQDIDAISSALEQKFNPTAGVYTAAVAADFASSAIPLDPLNTSPYTYSTAGLPSAYTVCARLEQGGGNFTDAGTTPATGSTAIYYCRRNQQQ